MTPTHLTAAQLALRLHREPKTLANWRVAGDGPRFIPGRPVLYAIEDVERWEAENVVASTVRRTRPTTQPLPGLRISNDDMDAMLARLRTEARRKEDASHVGVYFLFSGDALVYVGQSTNVYARVCQHDQKVWDRWAFIRMPVSQLDAFESACIAQFQPPLNRSPGRTTHLRPEQSAHMEAFA